MTALAVVGNKQMVAEWGERQLALIRRTVAKDCNNDEFDLFINMCRSLNLDPLRKQIYAFVYNKDKPDKRQLTIVTAISGFRTIAERTGNYRPDEEGPTYVFDNNYKSPTNPIGLVSAKVRVYKFSHGAWHPVTETAFWDEAAPIKDEWAWDNESGKRKPTGRQALDTSGQWGKMPRLMLAKCFDEQTEVLTAFGFQKFADVSAPILQVAQAGLEPIDARPFSQEYDGEMVMLDSDDLNFSVTPNHDMVTTVGKIEARAMHALAGARATFHIPRLAPGRQVDADISDAALILSAAYLADGHDGSQSSFNITVSRQKKIEFLDDIALHDSKRQITTGGQVARTEARDVITISDKISYGYPFAKCEGLVGPGKVIDHDLLLSLSRRQARLFVDTWVFFDGSKVKGTGVKRLYSSRPAHVGAFEVACAIGGYAVSPRRARDSDISTKPNFVLTLSERDAIPVIRWGREKGAHSKLNARQRTGLELAPNSTGRVWCVTVPSGVIVVRRNGFSMLCGNCAEAAALRKAWPDELSNIYGEEEVDRQKFIDLAPSEIVEESVKQDRLERVGHIKNSVPMNWNGTPDEPIEFVPIGQFYDRCVAHIRDHGEEKSELMLWWQRNAVGRKEAWALAPTDYNAVKQEYEAAVAAEPAEA
jgi:phage recombination protein Bet